MDPQVIILGTRKDPHVERVHGALKSIGTSVFLIDSHCKTPFSFSVSDKGFPVFEVDGERLHRRAIVWDRVKLFKGSPVFFEGDLTSSQFRASEWRAFYSLISTFYAEQSVNTISAKIGLIKPYQQMMAAQAGFSVPTTVVTNN